MGRLTSLSKLLMGALVVTVTFTALWVRRDRWESALATLAHPGEALKADVRATTASEGAPRSALAFAGTSPTPAPGTTAPAAPATLPAVPPMPGRRPIRVALSQWPGHLALVVGNGGLVTVPGSVAAAEGLAVEIVFIEDAPSKNKALAEGKVDAIWQTVDELPISMVGFDAAHVDVRAFLQIDWSRGGDACVAAREVKTVEDVLGRKSAVLLFSPDHTVFEFMINNARFSPAEIERIRRDTSFSPDDFTYARILFGQGKVDVACLWEPDVTLALASRPGAHRLFSTADATALVADTLIAKKEFLDLYPDLAVKLGRVWMGSVKKAEADKPAAARVIATACPRFRDELGYEATLKALAWVKWTGMEDNVRLFGLAGGDPLFDRVYRQADGIWVNYPQAEIKQRFDPSLLRDDRVVRRLWESQGRQLSASAETYDPSIAAKGQPLFTKALSINFHSSKSELTAEAMHVLDHAVLPQVDMARGMYIRVEGNTDSLGDPEWNQALSEQRADAIVKYLVAKGVAPARIVAKGNGSDRPLSSNRTADGRARNRRTDILFIPAAQS